MQAPRWFPVLLPLLGIALLCASSSFSQSTPPTDLSAKLAVRVAVTEPSGYSFVEALCATARAFNIPLGISWIDRPAAREPIYLKLSDVSVLQIIEAIAHTQPNYEVRISNGVVHVYPTEITPDHNFLELIFPSFKQQTTMGWAYANLQMLVRTRVVYPPPQGFGGSVLSSDAEPKFQIDLADASVETVLDAMALSSPYKLWVVTFVDDFVPTPTGFHRTKFWCGNRVTPNDSQPIWEYFKWDYWPLALISPETGERLKPVSRCPNLRASDSER